jgi:enoyl-CoA hydratase/carnithine racemase
LIGTHRSLVAILEGKPFTPAEALANGAVDEIVPPQDVVSRATEIAEHLGSRPRETVAAIKRSVYFGGSTSLTEGLHIERTEFLGTMQSKDAQDLMTDYVATTDTRGELPLYDPDAYARALGSGSFPGRRSTQGR